jgi:very-short-patch-repair endonuclease
MQTQAEKTLWGTLRRDNLGVNFRRQHSKGNFILDFYCPQLQLAIEVDGATHDSDEAKSYDAWRQSILESEGLIFLRFTDEDILQETDRSIAIILAKIQELAAE